MTPISLSIIFLEQAISPGVANLFEGTYSNFSINSEEILSGAHRNYQEQHNLHVQTTFHV
jgi:hypothetical protein